MCCHSFNHPLSGRAAHFGGSNFEIIFNGCNFWAGGEVVSFRIATQKVGGPI